MSGRAQSRPSFFIRKKMVIKNTNNNLLVRIVKLSLAEEHISTFLSNFEKQKENIRNFNGCRFLELYRDKTNTNIFFTYSYWNTEADLENYRHSNLFKGIWAVTKPMFNDKPQAWSVVKLESLD